MFGSTHFKLASWLHLHVAQDNLAGAAELLALVIQHPASDQYRMLEGRIRDSARTWTEIGIGRICCRIDWSETSKVRLRIQFHDDLRWRGESRTLDHKFPSSFGCVPQEYGWAMIVGECSLLEMESELTSNIAPAASRS